MTSHIKVRYPAVDIDLGHGLRIETKLRRDALGSLLHARVPVMSVVPCDLCPDCGGTGIASKDAKATQVGTAVLKTWVTRPDGSAADLEFDLDLDDPALYAPTEAERIAASQANRE